MLPHKAIFAATFQFSMRRWHGDKEMASFLTAVTMTGAVGMNVIFVILLTQLAGGDVMWLPSGLGYMGAAAILLWFYMSLVRGRRYEAIEHEFSLKPSHEQRRWRRVALLYLLGSYVVTGACILPLALMA
jgi:hypothetical protein